jgi:hypothetical protein
VESTLSFIPSSAEGSAKIVMRKLVRTMLVPCVDYLLIPLQVARAAMNRGKILGYREGGFKYPFGGCVAQE